MGSPRRTGVLLLKIKTHVFGKWKVLSPPGPFFFLLLLSASGGGLYDVMPAGSYPPSIDPPLCF